MVTEQIDPVERLLDVLDVASGEARTTEDIFTARSEQMPHGRVFGGQVLAQAIIAAEHTIDDGRVPHSMHGYFLRPGDANKGITFSVDRIHDGRSFATRRTQAYQEGVPIFSMIASFESESAGLDHQTAMPEDVPAPESLADPLDQLQHPLARRMMQERPIELRYVASPIHERVEGVSEPRQAVWMRARRALPDAPGLHRAVLAYLSDMTIQESVLRGHGVSWARPGLKVASLDHAMWWHRPARVDEWLLYVQESPSARSGRGLATGRIYTREGVLAASVAQEIMIRVPDQEAPAS